MASELSLTKIVEVLNLVGLNYQELQSYAIAN
jgi:hypothetical protein